MNDQNTTNTTKGAPKGPLSPEEKAKREATRKANEQAMLAFVGAAEAEVAKQMGVPELTDALRVIAKAFIMQKAGELYKASLKTGPRAHPRSFMAKAEEGVLKALKNLRIYAARRHLSGEFLTKLMNDAFVGYDPQEPTPKREKKAPEAPVA